VSTSGPRSGDAGAVGQQVGRQLGAALGSLAPKRSLFLVVYNPI